RRHYSLEHRLIERQLRNSVAVGNGPLVLQTPLIGESGCVNLKLDVRADYRDAVATGEWPNNTNCVSLESIENVLRDLSHVCVGREHARPIGGCSGKDYSAAGVKTHCRSMSPLILSRFELPPPIR